MSDVITFAPVKELIFMLPEAAVTLGLLVILVFTMLTGKKAAEENTALTGVALVFLAIALGALYWNFAHLSALTQTPSILYGTLTMDLFSFLMRALLLVGAAISIAISHRFLVKHTYIVADFYILILGATLGGMVLSSASDLISVFVGLETLSITSYILAGYLRRTTASTEASFKYLVYGGVATAMFLFGVSLIYGLTGSTNFAEISTALLPYAGPMSLHPTLIIILLLTFSALAFKLSLAPFHMWAPDVYEGSPTPVAAFLSVVSKTAAFGITIRLLITVFSGFTQLPMLLGILAVLSMTIGNIAALRQKNIKRLLAYSTIAHAGYMLLGLIVGVQGVSSGIGSVLYYLMTYLFMNLGAFACVIYFNSLTGSDEIESYSGLVQKRPGLAACLTVFLLSLAGIPIFSGFFAKFFLFLSVAQAKPLYIGFVIFALLTSTVSLAYYLNIIRLMLVKEPSDAVATMSTRAATPGALQTSIVLCAIITVVLGFYATPFFQLSNWSAMQLFQETPIVLGHAAPITHSATTLSQLK